MLAFLIYGDIILNMTNAPITAEQPNDDHENPGDTITVERILHALEKVGARVGGDLTTAIEGKPDRTASPQELEAYGRRMSFLAGQQTVLGELAQGIFPVSIPEQVGPGPEVNIGSTALQAAAA
jgi:hypothetical protein